jgi:predicted RNA-binding Zn-ribbon protein involved in translation (DUF1610 family)
MSNNHTGGEAAAERASMASLLANRMVEAGHQASAISVAELHRVLLPYHECRDRLGLTSKGEYDVALLELLADPGLIQVDQDLVQAVRRELATPEPGLAVLKNFAAAKLKLRSAVARPDRVEPEAVDEQPGAVDEPAAATEPEAVVEQEFEEPTRSAAADLVDPLRAADSVPDPCHHCDGALPIGPDIRFCPHCGADQTIPRCDHCETELERTWKYCPRCGQEAEG